MSPCDYALATCDYVFAAEECPTTLAEAMASRDAEKWKQAAESEYNSLMENKTWKLVARPAGANVIKSKWCFKVKYRPDGSVERYKCRLVVKGCSQVEGVDYFETYSPVSKMASIRCLLSLAAANDLEMAQCDVTTAFLYGDLHENIYMAQPEGFTDKTDRVCKLQKSLYGLRQAPLQWNRKIAGVLEQLGMSPCSSDPCVYRRKEDKLLFALYVDDGLCLAPKMKVIDDFLSSLQKVFKMTRGQADCFIGIEIERDRKAKTIKLHQTAYVRKLLERFSMESCNPASTPHCGDQVLKRNVDENGEKLEPCQAPFRSLVGSLMYAAVGTRTDVAHVVSQLSQFLENPSKEHWISAKRVLRYLKATIDLGIVYSAGTKKNTLIAFSDASWASDPETRRSVSGVCLMMNGGVVDWKSKKQTLVTDSTTYAEYVAAHAGTRLVVWFRRLLQELGFEQELPTVLFLDNAAAEHLVMNPVSHERTKHFDVKFHYIRERYEKGDVDVKHVSTQDQLADMLTKNLVARKLERLRAAVGIR